MHRLQASGTSLANEGDINSDEVIGRSETRFRGLLDSGPDGVVIIGTAGRIVLVNAQAEKLFGYQREELLGKPIETLMPQRFRAAHVGHRTSYANDPHTRPMGAGLELIGRR